MMWALLDLTELIAQLAVVSGERNNERVVIAFSSRALGSILLLWATIQNVSAGNPGTFQSISPETGVYLILAAGLRLGVLPLHLPYAAESSLRRGFGTALRFVGAAASLALLAKVEIAGTLLTPLLMIFTAAAAFHAGWMWLRAPNALNARPYWMIGIASLAVFSALSGNPLGAAAWGCVLILAGGVLFLATLPDLRLNRAMLAGAWSLSALPFSLSAIAWQGAPVSILIFAIPAQALMTAGYIRHALRAADSPAAAEPPGWSRIFYPAGILLPVLVQILLGFIGWEGARQVGNWIPALAASFLTGGLVWASRRFRIFNPVRAHWVASDDSGVNRFYRWLWFVYRFMARIGRIVTQALEGEGGMMWTLLFLFLFIAFLARGIQ
jgi:hypothetical protein